MSKIRLQKFLADCGVASRRKCEELIARGEVTVNGAIISEQGISVDPASDMVIIGGKPINTTGEKIYILMNKPKGVITTTADPGGRKTVLDILGTFDIRVYPVGRLDWDTEGVLLLTNDGEMTNKLLHPSSGIWKSYEAKVRGIPSLPTLLKLRKGLLLDDGPTAPAAVKISETTGKNAWLYIGLTGGRYHQVKRMCQSVGHPVVKLRRLEFAGLTCNDLNPGEWRYLKPKEVGRLWALIKTTKSIPVVVTTDRRREKNRRPAPAVAGSGSGGRPDKSRSWIPVRKGTAGKSDRFTTAERKKKTRNFSRGPK